jgi:hypothetical protein
MQEFLRYINPKINDATGRAVPYYEMSLYYKDTTCMYVNMEEDLKMLSVLVIRKCVKSGIQTGDSNKREGREFASHL